MHLSRRQFAQTALAAAAGSRLAFADEPAFPGLTVRMHQPRNLEFPISELKSAIIPNEQFFVRSHFAVPEIDAAKWKLKVEGAIDKPVELTFADIQKLPSKTLTATIECAGNGRVHLVPQALGLQWGQGAVGNAEWSGIPLSAILDAVGVKKSAVDVVLEGADSGTVANPPSPGNIPFARSIPLAKAKRDEVLLAYKMNGETLPASHGFPLRAVVGGWYGMASVKWLSRIVVTDTPYQGFWQTLDYSYFQRKDGSPTLTPVAAMLPKAILAKPGLNEVIPAGKPYKLFGAAWAGERAVAKVEVSVDGGKTWQIAKLAGEAKPFRWALWEFNWDKPARGEAAILAKCTDDQGATQPTARDPDRRTYMINHLVPTNVTVR
jgi:DMSO/TMAO reductase YedYZ molybdopterin-dependent catalytic subunit